ncbi:MAG TPA: NnrS family protein [Woeseiaceae bacterium]|nr:NnrS family protein [Woeseiaceae bacterium]
MPVRLQTFLDYGFRPFFLLNGIFAVVVVVLWTLLLHGAWTSGPGNFALWHAHEMLVGFAMATIAGFLLTAIPNWTGRERLNGHLLGWLVLAWLCGRAAMAASGMLPAWFVAPVDLAFPLLLFLFVLQEIVSAGNRRNYPIIAITAVLLLLNLLYHLGAAGRVPGGGRAAIYLMTHTILLLITVIGGRVIPNFTANWMRNHNIARVPANDTTVDRLTILVTVLVGLASSFSQAGTLTGSLALAAAVLHGVRLAAWRGLATRTEPLLLVLHVAYAWLPLGYALMACAAFGFLVPPTAALHALTVGAIGTMILAMMTRVPLGHTGRPLHASRLTVMAYVVLTLAVIIRVAGPLAGPAYPRMIDASAAAWVLAFAIFSFQYWPILTRPRVS